MDKEVKNEKPFVTKVATMNDLKAVAQKAQEPRDLVAPDIGAWGKPPELSAKDLVIPRIDAMQGMSDKVTKRQAQFGQFRDSLNNDLIGDVDTPFTVLPILGRARWMEYTVTKDNKGKQERKFKATFTVDASTDDLPFEETLEDGTLIQRDRYIELYCLKGEDVKGLPYILAFRGMSTKNGKKLLTQLYMRNAAAGMSPAAYYLKIKGAIEDGDKGSYMLTDYELDKKSSGEDQAVALKWYKQITQSQVKEHREEV